MSLAAFFEAARPFLQGSTGVDSLRAVGPTPSSDADLAMYPWLVSWDQCRIVGELMPRVRTWVELLGRDWDALIRTFVAAHPPTGHSVPHVGEPFADWLAAHPEELDLPEGIETLADFTWTAFLARTAPDTGPDVDRRVFVRHYAHDPRVANRALADGELPGVAGPATLIVYRDERTLTARVCDANLATLAVLLVDRGLPLTGALAVSPEVLAAERNRLEQRGVLPHHAPSAQETAP